MMTCVNLLQKFQQNSNIYICKERKKCMNNCIFCNIIEGKSPCYKIYEDEDVLVFLDISKKYFGHTLVVPKKHCINTLVCDDSVLTKVILVAKKVAKHYVEDCDIEGVNIVNNNGESAGQAVGHLHYHIIPRGKGLEDKKDMELEKQQAMLKF